MGISRQRALPPEIFTDEDLATLDPEIRLTAIGLRMHADDQGRENANTRLLWSSIWPLSEKVTEEQLIDHLLTLDEVGYIRIYSAKGRTYYEVVDWPKVDHAKPSRLPPPPLASDSRTPRESFAAVEGEEGAGEGRPGGAASRTLLDGLPEPFCPEHPGGTFDPCGPCGTARMQHERALARRRTAAESG